MSNKIKNIKAYVSDSRAELSRFASEFDELSTQYTMNRLHHEFFNIVQPLDSELGLSLTIDGEEDLIEKCKSAIEAKGITILKSYSKKVSEINNLLSEYFEDSDGFDFVDFKSLVDVLNSWIDFSSTMAGSIPDSLLPIKKMWDDALKTISKGYAKKYNIKIADIPDHIEFLKAKALMDSAKTVKQLEKAKRAFENIIGYKTAYEMIKTCDSLIAEKTRKAEIEQAEKNGIDPADFDKYKMYSEAKVLMENAKTADDMIKAGSAFAKAKGYLDAESMAMECSVAAEKMKEKEKQAKREELQCDALFAKYKKALRSEKSIAKFEAIQDEITKLDNKITELENERAKLGFFSISKKKEITASISALEDKKQSKNQRLKVAELNYISCEASSDEIKAELSNYKYGKKLLNEYKPAKKGDFIKFGKYVQSSYSSAEDIEWEVLAVKDGKALIISRYALDCREYHNESEATWEICSLRNWLNSNFMNTAFSADERECILHTSLPADANLTSLGKRIYPGNSTVDRVFILSQTELKNHGLRRCECTPRAIANGARVFNGNHYCIWWLRTPGWDHRSAVTVETDGRISDSGTDVNWNKVCVRPAMWIYL